MAAVSTLEELRASIILLEEKQRLDERLLKEQLLSTYESLKPVNLIKNSVKDFLNSPDLKNKLLKTAMGLAAGYISRKAAVGSTHNPLRKLLGTFLQLGVANVVSNNSDSIKATLTGLLGKFLKKNQDN